LGISQAQKGGIAEPFDMRRFIAIHQTLCKLPYGTKRKTPVFITNQRRRTENTFKMKENEP